MTTWDTCTCDDHVSGCVGVHGIVSFWSLIAVGLFAKKDAVMDALDFHSDLSGVFYVSCLS